MSAAAPRRHSIEHDHAAVATATTRTDVVARAEEAGFVSAVRFTPSADIVGADTNTRRLDLINKGQDGNGATVIATKTFNAAAGTSADFDEVALTITEANDAVAAGDILALSSVSVGTGLADPGGLVVVEIDRQDA